MGRLGLPESPHSAVLKEAVAILRGDAALRRCVATWRTWDGSAADRLDVSISHCPAIRLTPGQSPDAFYGPTGMQGAILILAEVAVPGTNACDLYDLWHAVRAAFYPADDTACQAIRDRLIAAGAFTGEAVFPLPRMDVVADADNAFLVGSGQIRIDLRTLTF
jgi:hypothetical protein